MNQKELINSIKQLKEIKPRKEWAVLLKSQILAEKQSEVIVVKNPAKSVSFLDIISSVFLQRKLAYAFAVILFLIVGVFGLTKLLPAGEPNKQTASLTNQTELKQNVADLNTKVTELAKNLNTNSLKDPNTAKQIADDVQKIKQLQAKTLADVSGASDEKSLNDAVVLANSTLASLVMGEINDLNNTSLTDDQKTILSQAEDLYNQGKYTDALEKILLINK